MFPEILHYSMGISPTHNTTTNYLVLCLLNAVEARLPLIRYHSESVAYLSVELARRIGWAGKDLELLETAALLHDIGKIAIPDVILRKTEGLSSIEWDIMKLHPDFGVKIIEPVIGLQEAIPWIFHHHENWDGTGYPGELAGDQIPVAARIITIADSYDAITSERLYKKAEAPGAALPEIQRCAGRQFDPEITEIFVEMIHHSMTSGKSIDPIHPNHSELITER